MTPEQRTQLFLGTSEAINYEPAYSMKKVTIITASGIEKAPLIVVDRISYWSFLEDLNIGFKNDLLEIE